MGNRIHVTQPIDDAAVDLLRQHGDVSLGFGPDAAPLAAVLPEVHALLVRDLWLGADLIARAPGLRIISRWGVGFDKIDLAAAAARGVYVCITADANARAVAETVFGLALAVRRNIAWWDRTIRSTGFEARDRTFGRELCGTSIGIVGIGRIGTEVARIAQAGFGMEVLAFHPTRADAEVRARGAEPVEDLETLLRRADLVSLHVPLTPATRGMLGPDQFQALRREAVLIDVSRGGVVDQAALVDALERGELAGAGVDVYETEPPPPDHPLFRFDNVVLTPHNAAHTREAYHRMSMAAAASIVDVLHGRRPPHVVNDAGPQRLEAPR